MNQWFVFTMAEVTDAAPTKKRALQIAQQKYTKNMPYVKIRPGLYRYGNHYIGMMYAGMIEGWPREFFDSFIGI